MFPLFLAALWICRIRAFFIPRTVLLFALCGAAATTAYGYLYVAHGSRPVALISRLQDDANETETDIFLERLDLFLKRWQRPVETHHHYASYSTDSEARQLFTEQDGIAAVVWGNQRFVGISFPQRPPVEVRNFGALAFSPRILRLRIVDSVLVTGLSYTPRDGTALFLAALFDGITPQLLPHGELFDSTYARKYLSLHFVSDQSFGNFSDGHRSFALWRSGTDSLKRYLNGGAQQTGYLDCAEDDLVAGRHMLRPNENPELLAAIDNNLGVVTALHADLDGDNEQIFNALHFFAKAIRSRRQHDVFGIAAYQAFRAADFNSDLLNGRFDNGRVPNRRPQK